MPTLVAAEDIKDVELVFPALRAAFSSASFLAKYVHTTPAKVRVQTSC